MTFEYSSNKGENKEAFLPYDLSYIPDELEKRAKSELFEDEDTRVQSLKQLRTMLASEPDLHWQDDDLFLLAFLRARKFDIKRAFNLIKTFYSLMEKHQEIYRNIDFNQVIRNFKRNHAGYLQHRDNEGCAILVIRAAGWNPSEFPLKAVIQELSASLIVSLLSPATQIAGFKVIIDLTGLSLAYLPYLSPTYIWLFTQALQSFPGRFRAVHVVNEGFIWSPIWKILKPFLSQKIKDRFNLHGKNIKNLHKYFHPNILPAEYEGKLPPFDSSNWVKRFEEYVDYLLYVSSHGYMKKKAKENSSRRRS